MFNVCPGCGAYSVEKAVDDPPLVGTVAVCPTCGHRHPFLRRPLFVLTGASGAGKTAVALALPAGLPDCVILESDILWRPEFATDEDGYRSYRDLWLRIAKNIHQSGRSVVICGSAIPEQFESCPERRYIGPIHYLALVCDDDVLAARLRARPDWRAAGSPDFVSRMIEFNAWLRSNTAFTNPPMTPLDTTDDPLAETVGAVEAWVRDRLDHHLSA